MIPRIGCWFYIYLKALILKIIQSLLIFCVNTQRLPLLFIKSAHLKDKERSAKMDSESNERILKNFIAETNTRSPYFRKKIRLKEILNVKLILYVKAKKIN